MLLLVLQKPLLMVTKMHTRENLIEIRAELEKEFKADGKSKSSAKSEQRRNQSQRKHNQRQGQPKSVTLWYEHRRTYEGELGGKAVGS